MAHDHVVAKYYIETKRDLKQVAEFMVELETTAGWQGPGSPTELFEKCRGDVLNIEEQERGKGYITVGFPLINFNLEEAAFSSIWLTLIGGGTHALKDYEKSRLVDFDIPESALAFFPGPQFGIKGTREVLQIDDDDPIIGTIVKPTAGLTPEEVRDICYESALSGLRFIKDDEKMLNARYCPLKKRVQLVSEALQKSRDKTGKTTLYAAHISAGPEKLLKNAEIVRNNGASALMVNFFASGFHSLEMLAKGGFGLPIYAHCGGKEAMGRAEGQGISPEVIGKFARLMGADFFRTGVLGSYLVGGSREELTNLTNVLINPMAAIKDTVPVMSGGLNPSNLMANLEAFGVDVIMLAGTGITSYHGGIAAGVKAMLDVVKEYLKKNR